jgi:L-iditol 2-dehydrogenase
MKQAVLQSPGTFEVVEAAMPEPAADELLVRVAACGVCASELDMFTGQTERSFPLRPGHEVSGVVERVGAGVTRQQPGDRVGVWVTEAGFSEYVTVNTAFALPAGDMPLDLALAEPVACAVNAVEIADVRLGDDVAIIGAGFMGALVLKLVLMRGPRRVFVADTRPEVLERARAIGATHTVDVRTESRAAGGPANTHWTRSAPTSPSRSRAPRRRSQRWATRRGWRARWSWSATTRAAAVRSRSGPGTGRRSTS